MAEPAQDEPTPAERLYVSEFSRHSLASIDALNFVGRYAKSPNHRFRLIWSDRNSEGSVGGHRNESHGRWALLEHDALVSEGTAERPNDGKVADDGTFVLNDWRFGDGFKGRFLGFRRDGREILSRDFAANLIDNGISPDGRFAICQTANAPGSEDSCLFLLFDLDAGSEVTRWAPETGWVERYEFDTSAERLFLVHKNGERVGYDFTGVMVDRAQWEARRVAAGDLSVIRGLLADRDAVHSADFVERVLAGLDVAAASGELRYRARALRLRGELLEETSDLGSALAAYDLALTLDPQVGSARRADELRKRLQPVSPGSSKVKLRKLSRFERQAERADIEHEVIALEAGGSKLWRHSSVDAWSSVEEAALAHYATQGWDGAAAEGGLILTLIKAASLPKLAPRNADTFIEALYAKNVAFEEDRFTIGALLSGCARADRAQLERNWAVIAATAGESPAYYPRVRWHHVVGLFDALGRERLADIARLFAEAPYDLRAGWPDLTLWQDEEVRFVEVKAPSDAMHASQARLISTILRPLGYRVTLAEVRPD